MSIDRREAARAALALLCTPLLGLRDGTAAAPAPDAYDLALVSHSGQRTVLGRLPDSVFAPRVSPDGRRIAFELREPSPTGVPDRERIWIADLDHPERRHALPRVGTGRNWAPLWSHDGRRVVFLVSGDGTEQLHWQFADGSGHAEFLVDGLSAEAMTVDGRKLAFVTLTGDRDYGISLLYLPSRLATPLVDQPRSEQHSSNLTPDGRWIAYASNETGRHEIWIEPLPSNGQRHRISSQGGSHPVWSPTAQRVYFDRNGQLYVVDLDLDGSSPKIGAPRPLAITGFQQGYRRRQYDVMPDGKRFLMLFPRGG